MKPHGQHTLKAQHRFNANKRRKADIKQFNKHVRDPGPRLCNGRPVTGHRERQRRYDQIARGQITESNGLVV